MPNSHLQHTAQAGVGGDVKDVQAVPCESSAAVQVTVPTAALSAKQADANMGSGAWTHEPRCYKKFKEHVGRYPERQIGCLKQKST